ncbi:MAG: SAM-dependent methyltransferase [Deltaproteobacteria bacterium]
MKTAVPRPAADRRQEEYFNSRAHGYLDFKPGDVYAQKMVERVIAFAGLAPGARLLEIGAGAGRFSLLFCQRGFRMTCLDISRQQLTKLEEGARRCGIAAENLTVACRSLDDFLDNDTQVYDAVIGYFILHHLEVARLGSYLRRLRPRLRPGGLICFLEPNRYCPLYPVQILWRKDLSFPQEKNMYLLSQRLLGREARAAGYGDLRFKKCGLFPPLCLNAWPRLLDAEAVIERIPPLKPVLPFLMMSARR